MHSTIDLNLLIVAESLFRHLSVTAAAQELGLSQSATSHALGRLREHYGDPLFVRISKGMAPTVFAKGIQREVTDFVARARELSSREEAFDPAKAKGRVVIYSTDYFEIVAMPQLLQLIRKKAPGLQISLRPTVGKLPLQDLEGGVCDLAIAGFYEKLPEGCYRTPLFTDTFSVAMRKSHPLAKGKIGAREYFQYEHAQITLQGDFDDDLGEKIDGASVSRNLVYGSSSFTGPAWVVAESDLILTGPTLLLTAYAKYFPITARPSPVKIDPLKIQMVWHALTHQDPLKKWFREQLRIVLS